MGLWDASASKNFHYPQLKKPETRTGNTQSSPKCQQPIILWSMNSNKKKTAKWILNWDDDMDHLRSEIYGKTWTWYTRNFYSETERKEAIIKQMTITPKIKERGSWEMMELWESLGFVPNVAFVWFSLVLLLNLDWTEKWINLLEKILYDNDYYCYLPAMSLIFLRILLLKSLSFGSLWWLLPSILGILFPLCTGDIYLYICLHASCLQ